MSRPLARLNEPLRGSQFLRKEGELDIYLYPSTKFIINSSNNSENDKIRCLNMSKENNRKIILVLGQMHSGKTTLLNSFVNALCDIQFHCNFRYVIADESLNKPNESKTSNIIVYHLDSINCNNQSYTLIDTPGFSPEVKYDEKIIQMIFNLFKNWIDKIDAVCFVINSNSTKNDEVINIWTSIISLLGKDVGDIFIPMFTFCDIKKPQILEYLLNDNSLFQKSVYNHIKRKEGSYFKFNNSAIFENNKNEKFVELFWEYAMNNIKLFFEKLSALNPKSLNNTRDTLNLREKIQNKISTLKLKFEQNLSLLETLKELLSRIKTYKKMVEDSKNYKFKIKKPIEKKEDLPPGKTALICISCNFTCNSDSKYYNNIEDSPSMDSNGNCIVCKNKCHYSYHKLLPYCIKYEEIEEEHVLVQLKKQHEDSIANLDSIKQIFENKKQELNVIIQEFYNILN
jgi:GTPase SAR1 family protein